MNTLLFILLIVAGTVRANITTGLRSWYGFEGNLNDSSGNGFQGAANGTPAYIPGRIGQAVQFDASGEYVDIGPDAAYQVATVAAWVRLDADLEEGKFMMVVNGWTNRENIGVSVKRSTSQGGLVFLADFHKATPTQYYNEQHLASTTHPALGTFYHVAATYDGSALRLYVNGVLEAGPENSVAASGPATPDTLFTDLRCGTNLGDATTRRVTVDELRIYDRALTATDVAELRDYSGTAPASMNVNTHRALLVRAQAQYFSAPDSASLSLAGNHTAEIWLKLNAAPGLNQSYDLISKYDESGDNRSYLYRYQDVGGVKQFEVRISSDGTSATTVVRTLNYTLPPGEWCHVAFVYTGGTGSVSIYVNGVAVGSGLAGLPTSIADKASAFQLGRTPQGSSFFDGSIDEVRLWATARSPEQIRSTMFNEFLGTEANLCGYWKLNNSLADNSPNANMLTNVNGASFESSDLPFFNAAYPLAFTPDKNTRGLWHLEDNSDSSGNGYALTNNGVLFVDAKLVRGAQFGVGNSDKSLSIASDLGIQSTSPQSYACWISISSQPDVGAGYYIFFRDVAGTGNGNLRMAYENAGGINYLKLSRGSSSFVDHAASAVTLLAGAYYFVVGTYDGATLRLYLNGVLISSQASTSTAGAGVATEFTIGMRKSDGSQPFCGSVDEMLVSSRVFSAEEILKYYGGIVTARFAPTVDGVSYDDNNSSTGRTWAQVHDSDGTQIRQGVSLDVTNSFPCDKNNDSGTAYRMGRALLNVNTSSVPDTNIIINHAALNLFVAAKQDNQSDSVGIGRNSSSSNTAIAGSDINRVPLHGEVMQGEAFLSAIPTNAYYSFAFDQVGRGWINQTGFTKLSVRLGKDYKEDATHAHPPNSLRNEFSFNSVRAPANQPYLLVEYVKQTSTGSNEGLISGTVTGMMGGATVVVRAKSGESNFSAVAAADGQYVIAGLPAGRPYSVFAFQDSNGNQAVDPTELVGFHQTFPLLVMGDMSGINIALAAYDSDSDGMIDSWEVANGLTVGINDAALDKDGDGLTNVQEFWLGLAANNADTDGDGLSDFAEVNTWGTSPLLADSDGDGIPDKWETDNGLDPRRNDADEDSDFDFVSNREEFNAGVNSTKANSGDSDGDGVSDYVQAHSGQSTWQAVYDRNGRLLGTRDARGASFAYRYDGNGNLIAQSKLGFDSDGDGLSDLWEFGNGLDPHSANGSNGKGGDADGDGWSNLQEQLAGTDPNDKNSKPGANGTVIGSVTVPFPPTNFVVGTGQLDYAATAEVVVSADGNPGTLANSVRVLTQAGTAWASEEFSIGSYGVTSIAVGQVGTRPPAIYLGLRKSGGTGRVVEVVKGPSGWKAPTVIVESVTDAACVTGIRRTPSGNDLILTLAPRFGLDGALYRAAYESGAWKLSLLDQQISHFGGPEVLGAASRGCGVISNPWSTGGTNQVLRLLDAGGIQISDAKTYPSLDEFGDTGIDPIWLQGGGSVLGSSWSVAESAGTAQLRANWGSNGGQTANAWIETTLQSGPTFGILISIPSIGVTLSPSGGAGGSSEVNVGATSIYSVSGGNSALNVLIHILKMDDQVYYRTKIDTCVWGNWNSCPASPILRFQSSGTYVNRAGNAYMDIDYVRYLSPGTLVSAASSSADFPSSNAAFFAASQTWYFKTPSPQTWLASQLYASGRGGNLVTIDSANTNSWLQGKFTGDFWLGYYRDFDASSWKWVSGSTATFTPAPTQPGGQSGQYFAFANGGTWSAATAADAKAALFEVKQALVEVASTVEPEPTATHRIQWAGQTLASGRFNTSNATQTSAVEAFIDDKDGSNSVTAGDEFVLAEYVLDTSPAQVRTLSRRPLSDGNLANSYGFAAVRSRSGASDFLVTGENDGTVCAWLPPMGGGALQRKVLSLAHVGSAWRGMNRVAMGGGTDGLVGVRVNPSSPLTADVVFWSPYELGFSSPPVIQQSAPLARICSTPASGAYHSIIAVKIWDSEGNRSRVTLEYQQPPGTGTWQPAALLTIDGQPAANSPELAAPVGGATHTLVWNAMQNLGSTFTGPVLLRCRATDFGGSGTWSDPMYYFVDMTVDIDRDGLPDSWEIANGLDPNAPNGRGDFDQDGIRDLMEFALDLNPREASLVGLPVLAVEDGYLTLTVRRNPAAQATLEFRVEVSSDLDTWLFGPDNVTVLQDSANLLKARDNVPIGVGGSRFIRLEVVVP